MASGESASVVNPPPYSMSALSDDDDEELGAEQQVYYSLTDERNLLLPPIKATQGSAGIDIRSAISTSIPPASWRVIPSGLRVCIPPGYFGSIRPRSSLTHKEGVMCALGLIDADFRGEIQLALYNFNTEPFNVQQNERIAQLVIEKYVNCAFVGLYMKDFDAIFCSPREVAHTGFGSTGKM